VFMFSQSLISGHQCINEAVLHSGVGGGNRKGRCTCTKRVYKYTQVQNCILARSAQSRNSIPIIQSLNQAYMSFTANTARIPHRFRSHGELFAFSILMDFATALQGGIRVGEITKLSATA